MPSDFAPEFKQRFVSLSFFILRICCTAMLLCAFVAASTCRAQDTVTPPAPAITAPRKINPAILITTPITPGCILHVDVKGEPALSGEYPVDASGAIHFTLSDDEGKRTEQWSVTVRQKTVEQARDLITESLKTYLRAPEAHVAIIKLPGLRVELGGSGCQSGPLELPLDAHLSDILFAFHQNADLEHILILRRQSGQEAAKTAAPSSSSAPSETAGNGASNSAQTLSSPAASQAAPAPRTLSINFLAFQQGESADDPKLQDGDRIYIQTRPEGKQAYVLRTVRVVGEVGREADIPLEPNMTVREALSRAGGVKDTADKNKIRLHRGEGGRDYDLKLAGIQEDDPAVNLKLMPGDYIVVSKTDLSMRWGIDGEVFARSVFPYIPAEHMTVARAIDRVGGLTKKADHRKGVLRKGYLINPTSARDIFFDYDAILHKKQTDWAIDPGDVVFVLPRQKRPTLWQQLLPLALKFIPIPL